MARSKLDRMLEEYMNLPYRMEVYWDEDCWAAEFPELPGLIAAHETWDGLRDSVEDAKRAWFSVALERNDPIQKPIAVEDRYSGKLNLRLPKSLHAAAARASERDGVSLNTFIVTTIAKELGAKQGQASAEPRKSSDDSQQSMTQAMREQLDAARLGASKALRRSSSGS
jgi:antitoxin HicB